MKTFRITYTISAAWAAIVEAETEEEAKQQVIRDCELQRNEKVIIESCEEKK